MLHLGGNITGGEHHGIVHRLQGVVHGQEAALHGAQAAGTHPGRGRRTGTPEQRIKRGATAIFYRQLARAHRTHAAGAVHRNTRTGERLLRRGPGAVVVAGQDVCRGAKQAERGCAIAQAVCHGQRQLNAAGAAPYQGNMPGRHALPLQQRGFQSSPARPEFRHRLDRRGVLARARHTVQVGLGANVQAQHIVGEGGTTGQAHLACAGIQRVDFGLDEARASPLAEPGEVDVGFRKPVVAGEQAGKHARIGRMA